MAKSYKGTTYYGIGSSLARIIEVIMLDQRAILSVSSSAPETWGGDAVTFSLPHLVGGEGIIATLSPHLAKEEEEPCGPVRRSSRRRWKGYSAAGS